MKTRTFWSAVFVLGVTFSSGCCLFRTNHPCFGWRLHPYASAGGVGGAGCCTPCCPAPGGVAFRPPVVTQGGPDCPTCATGEIPPGANLPAGYPPYAYPPIIGNPMPLPGTVPGNELHNPNPVKKTGQ